MNWQLVTPTTLVSFLRQAHERTTVDFKRDYDRSPVRARYELAKDVLAFANALGGSLLVGAIEGHGAEAGRAVRFQSVPDVATLVGELTEASRLCYPLPVFEVHRATLTAEDQTALLGRPYPSDAGLLVVNVQASLAGPLGCLGADENGKKIDHAYRFPVRTSEGTRYLRPDELPFHMNSHERRTLLQLRQLAVDAQLDVWGRTPDGFTKSKRCSFLRVDAERLVLVIDLRNGWPQRPTAEVPLAVVKATWRGPERWQIAIEGTVFTPHRSDNVFYGFVPLGGLVDD